MNRLKINGFRIIIFIIIYAWIASLIMMDNNISKIGYDVLLLLLLYFLVKKKHNIIIKKRLKGMGSLPLVMGGLSLIHI